MRPKLGLLAALSLSLVGCAVPTSTAFNVIRKDLRPIPVGRVSDLQMRITAADSSFVLQGGKDFEAPYQLRGTLASLNADKIASAGWREAMQLGAKSVIVTRGPDRFFGVLALLPATNRSEGLAANNYRIELTDALAAAARNGRIAFVGERAKQRGFARQEHWTWILWISDSPFGR